MANQTNTASSQPRIWATRASHQNEPWCDALNMRGYSTIACPLIEIVELKDSRDHQSVKNCILSLDQFEKLIFVSQNAAAYGLKWIDQYWPQLPHGQSYYAVGSATAKALNTYLHSHNLSVVENGLEMNTEALLNLDSLQILEGQGILIFRGKGGRAALGEQLIKRGANIDYCELYHRQISRIGQQTILNYANTIDSHDIFPVFSGEALNALADNFRHAAIDISIPTVIVPGKRVQMIAQNLGFKKIITTTNASESCMLNNLLSLTGPSA